MEGEAYPAPVGADADIAVEKVVACLGILNWAVAPFWHELKLSNKPAETAVFYFHV